MKTRLSYLDWMRGLGAAIMLQGHVMDGWLRPEDRSKEWFWRSQFLGGLPSPIFLFLVGTSLALVLDRLRAKNASSGEMMARVVRRGGWILLLAYAFRIEQYLVWYPAASWSGVFRVDTLNCIGACTLFIGLASIPLRNRRANAVLTGAAAFAVVLLTPYLYVWRAPMGAFIRSYFNGDGNTYYFSVIPWIAFALLGMAFGFLLIDARERAMEKALFVRIGVAGVCAYAIGAALNLSPVFQYGFFDYSLTSPHFFLVRLGYVLLMLYTAYRWSLLALASLWSPLRTLGRASLLVYWVHIDLVYGRLLNQFNLTQALSLSQVALHLSWIFPSMIALAWLKTNWRSLRGLFQQFWDRRRGSAAPHFRGSSTTDRSPLVP